MSEETNEVEMNEEVNEAPPVVQTDTAPEVKVDGSVGIDETREVLKAFKHLAGFAGLVLADGAVKLDDLKHLGALATKMGDLGAAVKDIDEVANELKDLDQAELIQIIVDIYAAVKAFAITKKTRILDVY